jgi:hypothetical protein
LHIGYDGMPREMIRAFGILKKSLEGATLAGNA